MQTHGTEEALKELELASAEHLAWLKRVHCSLLFKEPAPHLPPSQSIEIAPIAGDEPAGVKTRVHARLSRARCRMQAKADALLDHAGRSAGVTPDTYLSFMESVEEYDREVRRLEALLRRSLAETDPLTGVHNRQGMAREISRERLRAQKAGEPLSIALADLDHFKLVNDTYGHQAGDAVLAASAAFFVHRLRPYDLVFRYGGEEFLFVLPNTDASQAKAVLDRLCGLMARAPMALPHGKRVTVTTSMGVAQMTEGMTLEAAIAAADHALYRAKSQGRNRVNIASETDLH